MTDPNPSISQLAGVALVCGILGFLAGIVAMS